MSWSHHLPPEWVDPVPGNVCGYWVVGHPVKGARIPGLWCPWASTAPLAAAGPLAVTEVPPYAGPGLHVPLPRWGDGGDSGGGSRRSLAVPHPLLPSWSRVGEANRGPLHANPAPPGCRCWGAEL